MPATGFQMRESTKFANYLAAFLIIILATLLFLLELHSIRIVGPTALTYLVIILNLNLFFVGRIWRIISLTAIVAFCLVVLFPSNVRTPAQIKAAKEMQQRVLQDLEQVTTARRQKEVKPQPH